MIEKKARSYIIPLLLILLGVALLLDQLGVWYLNWSSIWKLWPLLLVFIGLDIILRNTRWGHIASLVVAVAAVILVIVFALPGGSRDLGVTSKILNYPVKDIRAATVRLKVGAGELDLSPLRGSGNLYEARIDYDPGRISVADEISITGEEARVVIEAAQLGGMPLRWEASEEWRVGLHPDVLTRLDVNTGVGRADIDLTGLRLSRLGLNVGVGPVELMLSAEGTYNATVNGGVGAVVIEIPKGIEAYIRVNQGIGTVKVDQRFLRDGKHYMSPGYSSAKANKVDLDIDAGIGSITIR